MADRTDHKPLDRLSVKKARRIALAAQGFADRRPSAAAITPRHMARVFDRVGLVQIDSVNVLSRSHYLPFFSRLGPYGRDLLDRQAYGRKRYFEYWGHEASFIPVALQPAMRWRMHRARAGEGIYSGLARFGREKRAFIDTVLKEIEAGGPTGASGLAAGGKSRPGWWEWGEGKTALEWLFWAGYVTTATRRNFERVYDLTERVLPQDVIAAPTPDEAEAQRALLRVAAKALGIATERDLRDYFRLPAADTGARIAELVEAGALLPVAVAGWKQAAYLDPDARMPRKVAARALLSPFDSLVWERDRAERLFDFRYRLEIYTPSEKRVHGYYVLPFLMGEGLVGRVCLKADRAAGILRVNAAHAEDGTDAAAVAAGLAEELGLMAGWLGLDGVEIGGGGDLAPALETALAPALERAVKRL
ncbi:winged helix-turn-helix domain-containing protein [Microbaculum marinisediminis]|uniref:Winged helix-turn-helix domain-containing protein n=1 Tax=Microbaculum marinisediminis TaxID=2931392 RepID=A0AAW5QTD6_9HYPH|nr:winged helix-turn-helix domain-containing protein [Microbaculum sp. A6E488]MCT8971147.1 winged helix-turn-helix domain-containing protein [Microbaculum sp. A6E488]